jgi:hypothetical protein
MQINRWHLKIDNKSFNIVVVKTTNMEALTSNSTHSPNFSCSATWYKLACVKLL